MAKQTAAEVEESRIVAAAEVQLKVIDRIVANAVKPYKKTVKLLVAVVLALLLGAGVSGYLYSQQYDLTRQVQTQAQTLQKASFSGCEKQNARAQADEGNWNFFITLALKGNPDPNAIRRGALLKAHIAQADAPRNCEAAYGSP